MAEVSFGGGDIAGKLLALQMVQNMRAILLEEKEKFTNTTLTPGFPFILFDHCGYLL
jgi:hypothetical protein